MKKIFLCFSLMSFAIFLLNGMLTGQSNFAFERTINEVVLSRNDHFSSIGKIRKSQLNEAYHRYYYPVKSKPISLLDDIDTLNYPLTGDYALYISDEGGYVTGNNEYGDLVKANYFQTSSALYLKGLLFDFAVATGGNPEIAITIWENNGNGNSPGNVKATAFINLNNIKNDISGGLLTYIPFEPPVLLTSPFYAGFVIPTVTGDTLAVWSNTDGNTVPGIAWEQWDTGTWYPMNSNQSWSLDLSMAIFPVVDFELPLMADFTSSTNNIQTGQSVSFLDNSTGNPTSWEWIFENGNPGTSNLQNPFVNYQQAGSFDVTLTVLKDGESSTVTKSEYIHVGGSQIQIDTLNYPLTGEYAIYLTSQNGFVSGNNEYGDRAKANFFQNNQSVYITGVLLEFAYATGGNPNIQIAIWDNGGTNGTPGAKVGSFNTSLNTIKNEINNQEFTFAQFNPPISINSSFYAGFMLPTSAGDTLVIWSNMDDDIYPGIAWEQWNDLQWYNFSDPNSWLLNISLAIFPIVQNTLGLEDNNSKHAVQLFPNPSQGIYHIVSELFINEPVKFSIYKLDGTLVKTDVQINRERYSFDLTTEPEGIYIIEIEIDSQFILKKLVKQ